MSINYPIIDFPTLGVQSQLFYAGGTALEGGFTSGGARVVTPEPGGRAFLEMQVSLQVNEWNIPFASWLMSKAANGTIFRVPLVKTPQLVSDVALGVFGTSNGVPWEEIGVYSESAWDNEQPWAQDIIAEITSLALEGTQTVTINVAEIGTVLQYGHVIGIGDYSHIVDDIEYSEDATSATITVNPPLRQDVTEDDMVLLRPYFLGTVTNISEFRQAYERANNGHIQPGRLLFAESLL